MSTHPYKQLPDKAFWRRSLEHTPAAEVDPVGAFSLRIGPQTKVATAGSCFAQHIARHLHSAGFNYYVAERGHPILPGAVRREHNYELFSARYGNVYTARQLWQLLRRAYGEFSPVEEAWLESDGSVKDPFRPSIQPGGFVSVEEMAADRRQHLAAVREMFETLDVFVFTLGLTECWLSRADGAAFPLCPGVEGGVFDAAKYVFCNQTVEDVVADMSAFVDRLATINKTAKVVLTVSPVPLMATAVPDAHVLAATTYSKAVLRVAAETLCRRYEHVHYFPSYEIITGSFNRGRYYADDLRNVTEEGVAHVMRLFLQHATTAGPQTKLPETAGASDDHFLASTAAVLQVECDEVALDKEETPTSEEHGILASAENPPSTGEESAALQAADSVTADAPSSPAFEAEAVDGTTPVAVVIAQLETLKVRAFHTEIRSAVLEAELAEVAKRLARSDAALIVRGAERQFAEEQESSADEEPNTARATLKAELAALKAERATLKEQRNKQQALAKTFSDGKLKIKELGARVTAEKQANAGLKHDLDKSRADLAKIRQKLAEVGLDASALEKSNGWSAARVVLKAEGALRRSYRRLGMAIRKTPSKDVAHAELIVQSKYFDAAWYKSQYLDGAQTELEAALHYLRIGASQGHDPGPRFSSSYYLEAHKDVAQAGFNPLVHYVKFGEGEGRSILRAEYEPFDLPLPSQARVKPSPSRAEPKLAGPSYRFEAPLAALVPVRYPRQRSRNEARAGEPEAVPEGAVPLLLSGVVVGWLTRLADAVSLESIRAFSVLSGVDPTQALQFEEQSLPSPNLAPTGSETPPAAGSVLALGAAAGSEFADVWFINECDLRARLRATADRPDAQRLLRCYQYDPTGERELVLLAEHRIPLGELGLIDITTRNPYCALLFALSTPSGELLSVSLLPFPSLCRGGTHYGELLAIAPDDAYLDALRNVSRLLLEKRLSAGLAPRRVRIEVDLTTATGAERIFTSHLRQWLMRSLKVEIASAGPSCSKQEDPRAYLEAAVCTPPLADADAETELVLSLPADALPSLTVLLAAPQVCQSDSPRAFVIADGASGAPKWLVSPPNMEPSLGTLQPPGRGFPSSMNPKLGDEPLTEQAMSAPAWPLAIRFCDLSERDPARLIAPFAREKSEPLLPETRSMSEARVSVLYHPSGIPGTAGNLDAFLESLSLQDRVSVVDLVVLLPEVDHQALSAARVLLASHLGDKGRVVPYPSGAGYGTRLNEVAAAAQGELLLVADGSIILHDQRTLTTLAGLAQHPKTAAVSCMLLQRAERPTSTPVRFQSAGFFPIADPHTEGGRAGLLRAVPHPGQLPPATWPVAATSSQLLMVRADTWRRVGGFGSDVARKECDIEYGLRTAAQGYFHFCTSVVTASFLHEAHPSETKPVRLEAEEFAAATRAGTLLRSLVT